MFGVSPTVDEATTHVPILHLSRGYPTDVLCVSPMEGFHVHFEGRSKICPDSPHCRLCEIGRGRRFIAFFAVLSKQSRFLVRLTARAVKKVEDQPPKPGMVFRITNQGQKKPLALEFLKHTEIPSGGQMSRLELLKVLMSIHGLGLPAGGESTEQLLKLCRDRAIKALDREAGL